jgi:DNA invertase Pin-like site-specific DNA recombinase
MEEAVGYIRVSTEEQSREGVSLDAQEASIRAYATMRGLHLIRIFREEGVSGGVPLAKRPQGRLLVETLGKRAGPSHIVAVKLDRLFRSASDALNHANAWGKAKRALHVIDMGGNAVDTTSAMGKMFFTMTAAFAEMEKNLTGERTRAALTLLRTTGKVYCHVTPLGFDRSGDRLVVNRRETTTVKKIGKLRADGLSLGKIADRLNQTKVPTKLGGSWYAVTVAKVLARSKVA